MKFNSNIAVKSKVNFDSKIKENRKFFIIILITLAILLFLSIIFSVTFGSVDLSPYDAYRIIIYNIFKIPIGDVATLTSGASYDIIWNIRVPRVLLGAIVGMGLAIVGVVMQATVQNPLADPYILGLSSGASLGATFSILIGFSGGMFFSGITFWAFLGALISSILVYTLSNIGGRITSTKLILSGMIVSSICSAITSFIIFVANDAEGIKTITFWSMGSLTSASWKNIQIPSLIVLVTVIFFIFQFRTLNVMLLGNETSVTLGVDLSKYRKIYMVLSSLVTGVIVSVCGIIGFVGLIIPHIVRLIVGSNHKTLIPVSALVGSIFLIWTDVFSRTFMKGMEMPIGIITSILGAPFLMWLMIKKSYRSGGK
ncbi:FecCD family ABC transporter permease [Clostridium frigidicarnis]|uniref:Iron complex transport system permease protein n=1 Tax=Clostridium frigidicarnis TaxID=84698 RepID=A0A1I0W8N4_9CLOT|nr:iron ABC transporter permease [Clostridium frigidicarnis]SFA84276.1 iron complex transport system permease protein [Clostridium frigidicarnis]